MGGFVGGQEAWLEAVQAKEKEIKDLSDQIAPLYKKWEQAKFDLEELKKDEPNKQEGTN